ncbi:MAG: hypothetical protein JWL77_1629 [Chthonomonadaceae bacterium]|nr:hypothetical protein [Chthonomonadaceae bacterium]
MTLDIHILLFLLLLGGIFAVVRLYVVLGQVRQSLNNLEETRTEISGTLQRLESVAKSTEEVLRTEVTPTLQVTRATLANLEVTTRALAETTLAVRGLTGRAEQAVNAGRLLTAALPIARMMTSRGGGIASGLLAGIGTGIKAILGKKKSKTQAAPELEPKSRLIPVSDGAPANPILPPDSASDRRRESRKQ